jgi:hypothetical protein
MATWPKPESNLAPEGHYVFRLREDPEFEPYTYNDKKTGEPRQGNKITFFAIGANEAGEFTVRESFFVWDPRYADLCAALGVDRGRDIRMAGAEFEGRVIHEADRNGPTKKYARIVDIRASSNATAGGDDEVPPLGEDPIPF